MPACRPANDPAIAYVAQCREDEGYECREIYYIPDQFPGNFCLPTPDLVEPDTDNITELDCPWPWT